MHGCVENRENFKKGTKGGPRHVLIVRLNFLI